MFNSISWAEFSESRESWCWLCSLYMVSVNVYSNHHGWCGGIYDHIKIRRHRYTKKTSVLTQILEFILRGQCIRAMTEHTSQKVHLHANLWNMPFHLDWMTTLLFCFALLDSIVLEHVYSWYGIWFINTGIASQCLKDVGLHYCH